jgi:putative cardiolipin synthase
MNLRFEELVRTPRMKSPASTRPLALGILLLMAATCAGCVSLGRNNQPPPPSFALSDADATDLRNKLQTESQAHHNLSGFHIIEVGVDGLALRVQMVRNAQRTLDVQYFIFRGDETGSLFAQELRKAADRGVRVRVLVDDGDTVKGDERILALDGYRDVHVRVFNPFDYRNHNPLLRNIDFVLHKSRLDYRMHNKLLVADNAVALIGGRNVGNQYFQLDPASQFADDDVFVAGPTVQTLSHAFDEFWNSDRVVAGAALSKRSARGYSAPPPVLKGGGVDYLARIASGQPYENLIGQPSQLTWATAQVVYDAPDKDKVVHKEMRGRLMSRTLEQQFAAAQSDVVMVTPYFVPSEGELAQLHDLQQRGAGVRALSNSLESAPDLAAQSGYLKLRRSLLAEGVHLYEIRSRLDSVRGSGQTRQISRFGNYSLHAKLYVFDRQRLFIGSWNYDQRSLRINTEIGLLIDSPELSQQIIQRFDAMTAPTAAYQLALSDESHGRQTLVWNTEVNHEAVQLHREPSRGWWQRLKVRLLSWLPLSPEL